MATEQFDLENIVEIVKDDQKWLFGNIKGKYDIYGARYRQCFVLDQSAGIEHEDGNINAIKFHREWIKKEQNMFPTFKFSVDAQNEDTLEKRYLAAFNSNRPRNSYSYGHDTWGILVNFMGPILDTAPRKDPYDYDSDEDEWSSYEMNKCRYDYGCQRECCNSMSVINE